MDLMNFGREQLDSGMLNNMLKQVGINDVGQFVDQFRGKVNQEAASAQHTNTASSQQPDFMSMGSSFLNQVCLIRKDLCNLHILTCYLLSLVAEITKERVIAMPVI